MQHGANRMLNGSENVVRVGHAILDAAPGRGRSSRHAGEVPVREVQPLLEVAGLVVLEVHPILLVHAKPPSRLLREEPLEEALRVFRNLSAYSKLREGGS